MKSIIICVTLFLLFSVHANAWNSEVIRERELEHGSVDTFAVPQAPHHLQQQHPAGVSFIDRGERQRMSAQNNLQQRVYGRQRMYQNAPSFVSTQATMQATPRKSPQAPSPMRTFNGRPPVFPAGFLEQQQQLHAQRRPVPMQTQMQQRRPYVQRQQQQYRPVQQQQQYRQQPNMYQQQYNRARVPYYQPQRQQNVGLVEENAQLYSATPFQQTQQQLSNMNHQYYSSEMLTQQDEAPLPPPPSMPRLPPPPVGIF